MLGGIAPVLIFGFIPNQQSATFNAISGVPIVGDFLAKKVGIPVPLYLDEQLTGMFVESESKAMDIDTVPQQRFDGEKPDVSQRGLNNVITVNMLARKDSILLAAFLALNDRVFQLLVSQNYYVTYLNGPTTIFGGLLHGFSASEGENDNLVRFVIQISKANSEAPTPKNLFNAIPNVTGATPIGVIT